MNSAKFSCGWGCAARRWLQTLGVLSLVAGTCSAQGLIQMGNRQGSVSFGFNRDQTRVLSSGSAKRSFEQRRFAEALEFQGDLNILDPRFIQIQYGTSLDWMQDNSSIFTHRIAGEATPLRDEVARPGSGRVVGYALNSNVLPTKKLSFSIFGNRSQSISLREFAGSSETSNANRGVTISVRSEFLPSTIIHRQEKLHEESLFGNLVGRRQESRTIDSYQGTKRWNAHDLGLRYEHSRVQDLLQRPLSYDSDNALVSHRTLFGQDEARTLQSRLQYNSRRGQMEMSSLFLTEEFDMRHSKSLQSTYTYALSQFATDRSEAASHSLGAALQHMLYESLSTGASVQLLRTTSTPSNQLQSYKTGFTARYRKKVPWTGMLMGSFNGNYQFLNDQFRGAVLPIFQESHTARIGIPFALDLPGVVPASIRLRSDFSGIVLQPGIDYEVRTHGELTEISILLTGRIQDGETVLVDYSVRTEALRKSASWSQGYGVGAEYTWVSVRYDYAKSGRTLVAGFQGIIPEDLTSHTAGLDLRWRAKNFRGTFNNDYHTQDSELVPYDSLQFAQSVSIEVGRALIVALALDELLTHYRKPLRRTQSGSGRLSIGWTPWPTLSVDAMMSLRLWRDSAALGETHQSAGVRVVWAAGLVQVLGSYTFNLRRRDGEQSRDTALAFRVVRRF